MGWGKPKYGSNGPKGQTWRIKEGDNIYRYLPPMHSLAEEGKWAHYVTVHFGYAGTDPSDPTKTRQKPFRCVQIKDFRSGMILEDCPECTLYEVNAKAVEEREAELRTQFKAEGKDEKEIEELLETALGPDKGWLKAHSPDRKHYINAMTADGKEFGQFAISHRTKKQLDQVFKKLADEEQIDPLDLEQGVLINIRRTGRFRDAQDVVEVVKEKVEVEIGGKKQRLEQIKLRPLSEEESERALKECRDLTTVGGFELTKEQIRELTESAGDPEEVDRIFAKSRKEASPKPANDNSKPAETKRATGALPPANASTKPGDTVKKDAAANDNGKKAAAADNSAAIQARLAKIKAEKDAKAKAEAEAKALAEAEAAEGTPDADNALALSDEDFLAKFGG